MTLGPKENSTILYHCNLFETFATLGNSTISNL